MNILMMHVFHVFFVILFVGINFYAFAAINSDNRKMLLKYSGIFSLLVLLSGFGLHGMQKMSYENWVIIKIFCWFFLSGLVGMAYRFRDKVNILLTLNALVVLIALLAVYLKLI